MPSRLGIVDPIRSAGRGSNVTAEISDIRRQRPSSGPFSRAVVVEALNDPSILTEEQITAYAEGMSGGVSSLRRAPRNSLIVSINSGAGSSIQASNTLCYPFFSPHIATPINPGEQVWVLNDAPEGQPGFQYWISRVSDGDFCDDINFTHPERRYELYVDKVGVNGELATAAGDDGPTGETNPFDGLKDPEKTPGPPSFLDGPADDDSAAPTNPVIVDGEIINLYNTIDVESVARRFSTREIVPRYTKRPGDLVLQGSNNALICLGQDRGWTLQTRPDEAENSNASSEPSPFSGTVDIVVGRGRFYENSRPDPDNASIPDTQPRVILNSRDYLEVDKNPAAFTKDTARSSIEWNRRDRPQEGDPDFLTDASRIYVSMNAPADVSFSVGADTISPLFEGDLADMTGPFIVLKSDEVRIIARKETERQEINGSVRIIKEGTVGEDFASMYLLPDGVVQITGSKIYIGQPDQGNGPGEKKSEPYVKYSELEKLLEKTYDAIDQFCQKLLTHVTPGYGSPSPQINMGATELQTQILQRKQEIINLKSTRVFGE